jgi:UDP-2,4-diacetamido-2,4,6-trideoxy-beta-L-altropyranose hydrolase
LKNSRRVLFRADGNSTIGLGHIYRSLALVEMLKEHYSCMFLVARPDNTLKLLIEQHCEVKVLENMVSPEQLIEISSQVLPHDIIVLDGYDFDINYQAFIKSVSAGLVVLDDKADQRYVADLIINQGDPSLRSSYIDIVAPGTSILMGFDYSLVRPEFFSAAKYSKETTKTDSVFICMGGADP